MAKNTLYNFLQTLNLQPDTYFHNTLCAHAQNSTGKNYFHLDFQEVPDKSLNFREDLTLVLRAHHLSIYEHLETSQYHYTAYFKDSNDREYRLHIHFDENDCLVNHPILYLYMNNIYQRIDYKIEEQELIELALSFLMAVVPEIRHLHSSHVEQLNIKAEQLDAEVSSIELCEVHQSIYFTKAAQLKELYYELDALSPNKRYRKQAVLLKNIITELEKIPPTETLVEEPPAVPTLKEELVESSAFFKQNLKSLIKKNQCTLDNLLSEIKKNIALLKTLKSSDLSQITSILLATHHSLLIEISDNPKLLSVANIKQRIFILECSRTLDIIGLSTLKRFLLEGHFEQAEELVAWHNKLNTDLLSLALLTKHNQLLKFLMQRGAENLKTSALTIKNVAYPSALHYCFEKHSAHQDMRSSFSILLNHGASLLALDKHSKPLLFTILTTRKHPFQELIGSAQIQNESIFNPKFIALLKSYAKKNQLSPQKSQEIEQYINMLEDNKAHRTQAIKHYGKAYFDSLLLQSQQLTNKFSEDFIQQILDDSEISGKKSLLLLVEQNYLSILSHKEKMAFKNQGSQYLNNLIKLNIENNFTFEQLKKDTLAYLDINIKTFGLLTELHEVQSSLRQPQKNRKALARLNNRQMVLSKEIDQLNQPYRFLKSEGNIDVINAMQALQGVLKNSEQMLGFAKSLMDLFPEDLKTNEDDTDEVTIPVPH